MKSQAIGYFGNAEEDGVGVGGFAFDNACDSCEARLLVLSDSLLTIKFADIRG
jgi:hypothetical protein